MDAFSKMIIEAVDKVKNAVEYIGNYELALAEEAREEAAERLGGRAVVHLDHGDLHRVRPGLLEAQPGGLDINAWSAPALMVSCLGGATAAMVAAAKSPPSPALCGMAGSSLLVVIWRLCPSGRRWVW